MRRWFIPFNFYLSFSFNILPLLFPIILNRFNGCLDSDWNRFSVVCFYTVQEATYECTRDVEQGISISNSMIFFVVIRFFIFHSFFLLVSLKKFAAIIRISLWVSCLAHRQLIQFVSYLLFCFANRFQYSPSLLSWLRKIKFMFLWWIYVFLFH